MVNRCRATSSRHISDDSSRTGERRREGRREPLEDGGLQEEVLRLTRLGEHHLLGQVVEELSVARATLRLDVAGLGGEQDARDPPLRALVHLPHHLGCRIAAAGAPDARGLRLGEAEIALADLQELARAQLAERDAQGCPARHHEVHGRRKVPDQALKGLRAAFVEQVHVVEHQHQVVRGRGHDLVGERHDLPLHGALEGELGAEAGHRSLDARSDVGEEVGGASQSLVAGDPDRRRLHAPQRLGDQGALAVAGAGEDGDQPPVRALDHTLHEGGTLEAVGRQTRRKEPRQKHSGLSRWRSHAFSHLRGGRRRQSPSPPGRRQPCGRRKGGRKWTGRGRS